MKSGGSLDIEEGTGAVEREVKSTSTPTGPPPSVPKFEETARRTWIFKAFNLTKVSTQQKVLLLLCVAAAILDPLFFYIPAINGGSICLELDQKLGIVAIVLRSLVDVLYYVLWFFYWRERRGPDTTASKVDTEQIPSLQTSSVEQTHKSPGKTNLFSPKKAVEMLSILPLPQATTIAIIIMKGSPRLKQAVILLKLTVFIQFILRAIVLVPLCRKTMENSPTLFKFRFWVGAGFNLMFFILASHFIGAFWYLLSVGRTLDCWSSACWSHGGCKPDSLYCGGSISSKSYLNDYCSPGKTSNMPAFDFGIYKSAIESNIVASTRFPLKFTYCFWWGLQNLSSLGQNLDNSAYEWELCFSICISIIGLILVSLFIGNMQAYFQFKTQVQLKKMDKKEKKIAKIRKRHRDILKWETFQWLPPDLKGDIMACEEDNWVEATAVDLPTAVNCLPPEIGGRIIPVLCSEMQSRVKIFQALKGARMSERLVKPKMYRKGSILFGKDDPVGEMVILLNGTLNVNVGDAQAMELGTWDIVGEELLGEVIISSRMSPPSSLNHPPSRAEVKATNKVDAFVISANDLQFLMRDVKLKKVMGNISPYLREQIKLQFCLPILSKLPALEQVNEQPLKALCNRAELVSFSNKSDLVLDGSDVNKMFVIVSGRLCSYNGKASNLSEVFSNTFVGEELLQQALKPDLLDSLKLPVSTKSIRAMTEVEAFRIMASDVRWVRREFRGRFYKTDTDWASKVLKKALQARQRHTVAEDR